MKKTATSSIMSLVAVCPSDDAKDAEFSWKFRSFNFDTRISENYTGWQDMMLTGNVVTDVK